MQIVCSSSPKSFRINLKKPLTYLFIGGISLTTLTSLGFIILGTATNPTGNYLSPLPTGTVANNLPTITPTTSNPTPTPTPTFAESLNLAQNFLDKAFILAKNQNQTETDKKQIIGTLNQSLSEVNSAINLSPKDPKGYLLRAKILTAISKLEPEALAKAQTDLDLASKLSNGQEISLPSPINPINLIPDERATIAQNLIIAAPEDATSSSTTANQSGNTITGSTTFPAGQTDITIKNINITENSQIYLIPKTKGSSLYIRSKASGRFIIAATTPPTQSVPLDYWIINP
jgi:hypothetical protein